MRHERPDKNLMRKTMDCAKITARLCAYLDGGMDAAERDDLNRHLAACAACRAELAQQRQAETALTAARFALPPTGDLRADFYRRLQTENAARSKRRAIDWRLAVPSLAAVGLLALLWRPGQDAATKRNETPTKWSATPLLAAPQNFAKAEPMRHETLGGSVEKKSAAPRVSERAVSQNTALLPAARETPPSLPPSALPVRMAQPSASVVMQKTPQVEKPMQLASNATGEWSARIYGINGYTMNAPPQSALSAEKSFHFKATLDHGNLGEKAERGESAIEFDAALAYRDEPASKSESFSDRADASTLSAAAGLPIIISSLAPFYDNLDETAAERIEAAPLLALGVNRSKLEGPAVDDVDFEVRDEERGFASRTRVTASLEQRQDGETLTIEAEADNGS